MKNMYTTEKPESMKNSGYVKKEHTVFFTLYSYSCVKQYEPFAVFIAP